MLDDSRLTAVSLFTGAGGLDLGLESVGFRTLYATDIDVHSCITLEAGKTKAAELDRPYLRHAAIECADIADLDPDSLMKRIGMSPGEVDLLAGGPPCQAFSVFGRRKGRQDPRGMLVYDYLRVLERLRPTAFVFENVYGILSVEGGAVFDDVCEKLASPSGDVHYTLSILRLNAVDFGVPQSRDRVFIIGHRNGAQVREPVPLTTAITEPGLNWRTVRDGLRGIGPVGSLPNHIGRVHSDGIIQRYANLKPGERDPKTRINKLDLDRPSFTIIVGSDKGGGKGHVHPTEPREVTPRESARMQTFPDWWAFSGTSRHPIRQVGNAVPPLLGAAVGNAIRTSLFGLEPVGVSVYAGLLDQEHLLSEGEEWPHTKSPGQALTPVEKDCGSPRPCLASCG